MELIVYDYTQSSLRSENNRLLIQDIMIHTLDLHFLDVPQAIAAFAIETYAGLVLIETGPYSTYAHLDTALQEKGFKTSDVRHVLLTHIHFDHAGAAWAFARQGATIFVHPFGAQHLAHPEKLVSSARRIYQDDMDRLWGDMQPIEEVRLVEVGDQEEMKFGDVTVKAWHTPGHAVHHIAWQIEDNIFTGDVAGVRIKQGLVEPPCPPPDINIEDWQRSIKTIRSLEPKALYLTHFGKVEDVEAHLDVLEKQLIDWADWVRMKMDEGQTAEQTVPEFTQYVANQLRAAGTDEETIKQYEAANPSWMSVAGLMRYWKKKV